MPKSDVMQEYIEHLEYLCPHCAGQGFHKEDNMRSVKTFWNGIEDLFNGCDNYTHIGAVIKHECQTCGGSGRMSMDEMDYYISTWPESFQTRAGIFWAKNPKYSMKIRDWNV